jgi:hypothetical protein
MAPLDEMRVSSSSRAADSAVPEAGRRSWLNAWPPPAP